MASAQRICRLCLDTKDLQSSPSLYDGIIQAKIITIFNFPFDSRASLPSSICAHCLFKIDDFHEFTETVRQNQEQLKAREAILAQNIKVEPTVANEDPAEVKEPSIAIKSETFNDEPPVETIPVQVEHGEARVVSVDSNQCIVQSHQDETLQFKIEFEEPEIPRDKESPVEEIDKTEKEDRLIREFFSLNCETCSESFDSFSQLKQHTTVVHDKKLVIRCCNKDLTRRYYVLDHIALHLNPNHFQCEVCTKVYKRRTDLTHHRLRMHGGEEARPFKCDQCHASFPKSYLLNAHLSKHVQVECDVCHKKLSNPVSLRNHKIQVHSKGNKHVCDICGLELSSKPALQRHKDLHKPVKPEDRIACPICSKWFPSAEKVKFHIRYLHEGNETACDVCQQVYPNKRAMDAHKVRVHSKTAHECDICGKKFTRKLALKEHYSIHTGEKLYRCDLCGISISNSSFLYKHKKLKHPDEYLAEKQKAYASRSHQVDDQDQKGDVEMGD
ncbi:AAEL013562-PA [Aedes aegypti]|uniref:AAEL013562-PA n=1 Tax=Aedes aegypti TaxID=7159 RepID=Q16IT7_AEDAE|nr:AAEL013562-PA [Aedes aegypti]